MSLNWELTGAAYYEYQSLDKLKKQLCKFTNEKSANIKYWLELLSQGQSNPRTGQIMADIPEVCQCVPGDMIKAAETCWIFACSLTSGLMLQ